MRRGVFVGGAVALATVVTACGGGGSSSVGGSPTAWSYRPPRPPLTSVLDDGTISPRACDAWLRGTLVGICDPGGLQQAFDSHGLNDKGDVQVTVSGREVGGGGNSILAVFRSSDGSGLGIQPGETVTITGHVASGAYLYLRAGTRTAKAYAFGEALFDDLGLADGGTATVRVTLEDDHLQYELTRSDGTAGTPVATAGVGGPGPGEVIPEPPSGYADTPAQLARTYVAAVDARDGKTVCSLFESSLQLRYTSPDSDTPCWARVTAYIDFTGENAQREFKSMLLTKIGPQRKATVGGHDYVGLPLTLDVRFQRAASASTFDRPQLRQRFADLLWLEREGHGWRIAKASLALMAAGYLGRDRDEDPLAAPGSGTPPSLTGTVSR